ncbi:MAG: M50 family metallopeptidase [Ilumatobacteraceae bacterium]
MHSQPAFRLFGFPVHVRPGFYMFMVIVVIANGPDLGLWLAAFIAVLTLIHELGHAFAARATGARAEISLDLLAGYASFVPTRHLKRWERAGISFAGPAIQISVSMLALWAMGVHPLHPGTGASDAARALWWAGPVIGLFNLLPILPFDGGNIVLAGLEVVLRKKAKVVMLYFSLAITIGGGLWLLNEPRIGTIAIYAAIFPLMAQFQMLRSLREADEPTSLEAAVLAESSAWEKGDVTLMLPGQVPSPWYRANQQLHQTSPEMARAVLLDDFADPRPPRWIPPAAADEQTLATLLALLPRPLPTGNPHAEQALGDILLRLGEYDTAAHYAADSFQRSPSPVSAFTVARSAAALSDRDTAVGWLRAAENLSNPVWIGQALQQAPVLAQLTGRTTAASEFGPR